MTHVSYLVAGWGLFLVTVGVYAYLLIRRGRLVSARVPVERQRWMSTADESAP